MAHRNALCLGQRRKVHHASVIAPREKGWFLDLSHSSDEVLLFFVREARSQPARDELTCRYWCHFKTCLPRCGLRLWLTSWDLDDAHQEAFFWIQEAIGAFDLGQCFLPHGSSFETFLNRVLRLRLLDFCRSLKRRNARSCLVGEQGHWPHTLVAVERLDVSRHEPELLRQFERAADQWDPDVRALWDQLRQGNRLRDLPEILGVSYRTVKRRWRKLREQLIRAVRQMQDQA
jgi:RNA polymerase sigma factor (sigma-70 family)